jgi:hypothetical protein
MSTLVTGTIKSNTANPPLFQNTSGTEIGTLCRAWVNFDGVTTATIRASYNVSSVTRFGVGQYTINFTTAMPNTNYCVCEAGADQSWGNRNFIGTATVSSINYVVIRGDTNAVADSPLCCLSVFR